MENSNRFEEMRELFVHGKYFKLVCGAGNEDLEEVRRLSTIYTLGGCKGLDVSAKPEVVKACTAGIRFAYSLADQLDIEILQRPFIKVSVGMPGDHHVRKAFIKDNCIECDKCIPVCPTDAIPKDLVVIRDKCIGCGACEVACPPKIGAIGYEHDTKDIAKILPECIEAGAENIELHAGVLSDDSILEEWDLVCKSQKDHFVSLCVDRLNLSNTHLINRIRAAHEIAGDRFMVQADGVPMGGTADDYNTTLQAVAIADIIQKQLINKDKKFRNLPVLLSGGTNSKTVALAKLCDIDFCGVAIGTHARGIVKEHVLPFLENDHFDQDMENIRAAVRVASNLIDSTRTR